MMASSPRIVVCLIAIGALTAACAKEDAQPNIPQYDALHDPGDAPPAIRTAASAVVRIRIAAGSATGSFISSDGLLLTNNHVLGVDVCPREGCWFDLSFDWQRGATPGHSQTVFGVPMHVDVGLDVAAIQVKLAPDAPNLSTPSFLSLRSASSAALVGSTVYIVGHPDGHLKKWSTGTVAFAEGSWMVSAAFALPGNSGSPILDPQGRMVGIDHRGPGAIDLVAAHDVADYSIGTSSESLIAALDAPLPSTLRSIADPITSDDLVKLHELYLGAHQPMANIGGMPTPVISTLASACDAELTKGAFRSYDDFILRITPCTQAVLWFDCGRNAAPASWKTCPVDDDKIAWTERFEAVFANQWALNGELLMSAITTDLDAMESREDVSLPLVQPDWPSSRRTIRRSISTWRTTTRLGTSTSSKVNP